MHGSTRQLTGCAPLGQVVVVGGSGGALTGGLRWQEAEHDPQVRAMQVSSSRHLSRLHGSTLHATGGLLLGHTCRRRQEGSGQHTE